MAHLELKEVTQYANCRLSLGIVKASPKDLMKRFLSYHRYRWALPFKRKWWIKTYERVEYNLMWRSDKPSFGDCLKLMVEKNQAYGIEPLLLTGLRGIAIRCLSKSSRFVNLTEGADVGDETITDTLIDLRCYCILALMMIDGRLK